VATSETRHIVDRSLAVTVRRFPLIACMRKPPDVTTAAVGVDRQSVPMTQAAL
jgi:hypothetical protein